MSRYAATIAVVGDAVVKEHESYTTDNDEDREYNANVIKQMQAWFASPDRQVSSSAHQCIDRFIDSELDSKLPGDRGHGRSSTLIPRFAARHRTVVSKLSDAARTELGKAIKTHIVCGYLLLDSMHLHAPFPDHTRRRRCERGCHQLGIRHWSTAHTSI